MPTTAQILDRLAHTASAAFPLSVAWHGIVAGCALAIALGWRPSRSLAASLLSSPLASVSIVAWLFGDVWNGSVFALLSVSLLWSAALGSREPLRFSPGWPIVPGVFLVSIGWLYPHFLQRAGALEYAYGAPLGTLPCPTLAFVAGTALLSDGLVGRSWRIILGVGAAAYGLFGALRLGIMLDLSLVLGAIALFLQRRAPDRDAPSIERSAPSRT